MDIPFAPSKNYVTGTTRGLGQSLLRRLEIEEIFVDNVGLNRPEYDMSKSLDNYVKTDFQTYIINAHYGFAQTELLYKLYEANKDRNCQIIVIGSCSADGDRPFVNEYAIQKKALDAACTQLQLTNPVCTITQIKLGRIDTDLVKHIDAQKMNLQDVASKIYNVIQLNDKNSYIKSITIDNKEIK